MLECGAPLPAVVPTAIASGTAGTAGAIGPAVSPASAGTGGRAQPPVKRKQPARPCRTLPSAGADGAAGASLEDDPDPNPRRRKCRQLRRSGAPPSAGSGQSPDSDDEGPVRPRVAAPAPLQSPAHAPPAHSGSQTEDNHVPDSLAQQQGQQQPRQSQRQRTQQDARLELSPEQQVRP